MRILLSLIVIFLLACTGAKQVQATDVKENIEDVKEGIQKSKTVPKTVSGFTYYESEKAYFKNDLEENVVKGILKDIKNDKVIDDEEDRLSVQVKPIQDKFVYPLWSDFYGEKEIKGTIQLNMRIGKDGFANIIIVEKGINKEVDKIFVDYARKFPFKPAINKKSEKPVNSWFKFKNTF